MSVRIKLTWSNQAEIQLRRKFKRASNFLGRGLANVVADVVRNAYSRYGFEPRLPSTLKAYEDAGYPFDPDGMIKTGESIEALKDVAAGRYSSKAEAYGHAYLNRTGEGFDLDMDGVLNAGGIGIAGWFDSVERPIRMVATQNTISKADEIVYEAIKRGFEARRPRGML